MIRKFEPAVGLNSLRNVLNIFFYVSASDV